MKSTRIFTLTIYKMKAILCCLGLSIARAIGPVQVQLLGIMSLRPPRLSVMIYVLLVLLSGTVASFGLTFLTLFISYKDYRI